MVGDNLNNSLKILGKVRSRFGDILNLKDNSLFAPVWIVIFLYLIGMTRLKDLIL